MDAAMKSVAFLWENLERLHPKFGDDESTVWLGQKEFSAGQCINGRLLMKVIDAGYSRVSMPWFRVVNHGTAGRLTQNQNLVQAQGLHFVARIANGRILQVYGLDGAAWLAYGLTNWLPMNWLVNTRTLAATRRLFVGNQLPTDNCNRQQDQEPRHNTSLVNIGSIAKAMARIQPLAPYANGLVDVKKAGA